MTRRTHFPWAVVLLVAVGAALIVACVIELGPPGSSARTEHTMVTAEDGVVQSTVTGSGNVEPSVEDTVNFKISGTLQHVYVHVGEHVSKGQLLASLDPAAAQLSLAQAQDDLKAAEDQLSTAETAASTAATTAAGYESAGAASTDFVSYHPDARRTSSSNTGVTVVGGRPTSSSGALGTGTAPSSTGTAPSSTSTTRGSPSTTTGSTASSGSTGSTGSTASSGSTGSTGTSGSSASASSGSGSATGSASSDPAAAVASAQASVDSAEATVSSARQQLDDTKLYAPAGGTIVTLETDSPGDAISSGSTGNSGSSSASSSASSTGATAAGGLGSSGSSGTGSSTSSSSSSSGFAEIVNDRTMTMTVPFSESDIGSVKVGEPATVTLEALTGVELAAKVTSISTVGSSSSGVVSYDATLTLTQSNAKVMPGMSADASVVTDQASGVNLPNDAITGTGSLSTVSVVEHGRTTSRQVVVGLKGDSRTLIVSGLSAGDEVEVTTVLPSLSSSSASGASSSGTLGGSGLAGGGGFAARALGGGGGFAARAFGGGAPGGG